MSAVQFRGKEAVLAAFEKRGCSAWSLWSGKQFIHPCTANDNQEATQMLSEFLDMLEDSGSAATYTIKVYEDPTVKIREKDPCDGSFNFRFVTTQDPTYGANGVNREIINRIAGIEQRMKEAPEQEETMVEKVAGYIENNPWAQQIVTSVLGGLLKQMGVALPPATALAGVPASSVTHDDQRISAAVELLKNKDPQFAEHLEKLAQVPDQLYKILVTQLDQL